MGSVDNTNGKSLEMQTKQKQCYKYPNEHLCNDPSFGQLSLTFWKYNTLFITTNLNKQVRIVKTEVIYWISLSLVMSLGWTLNHFMPS